MMNSEKYKYNSTKYNTVQRFEVSKVLKMYLKLTKAALIWSKNKVKTAILWNIISIKIIVFYCNIL